MNYGQQCARLKRLDPSAELSLDCHASLASAALLTRFPYAIVFVESEASVRVISVMHGHRRPAYWQRRIG